jgi:hypothetical protein
MPLLFSSVPTADLLRRLFEYDAELGEITWRPSSYRAGGTPAALGSPDGTMHVSFGGWTLGIAEVAWAIVHGVIPDRVEHINGDRADNRLLNLRKA